MMARLLGWVTGLGDGLPVCLVAILLAGIAGVGAGWHWRSAAADAEAAAQIATLQAEQASQHADAERQARERLQAEQQHMQAVAAELLDARAQIDRQQAELKRRITHVTQTYRPAPEATPVPVPAPVVTWGVVRLWNRLTAACDRLPAADIGAGIDTSSAACAAAGAGIFADDLASGVSLDDMLAQLADYAGRCQAIEAGLNAYIEYHRSQAGQ
ncbi:hypothetical protein ABWL39_20400 [Chitinivorax sp. PXF-14]|uniref:hypothetical protein n=1 Tax=Chitinivorax sp. PXF-14 TaxID=3230488 RepID=UPI003467B292